jgi:O-antigen/teichoic acid export membrane protein
VLLPALNQLAHDSRRQTAAFLRAARVLTLVGAPLCIGLAASGSLFVRVFLDARKWDALPAVLGVLAVGMVFRLVDEPVQSLISAQGRFKLGFRLSLGTSVLYILVCTLGSLSGSPVTVAAAVACYYVVVGPVLLYLAIRVSDAKFLDAFRVFGVPFLLAVAAIAPWLLLDRWIPGTGRARDACVLSAVIAGSAATYLTLGRVLQPAGWHELLDRAQSMAPRSLQRLVARLGGKPAVTGLSPPSVDESPV